MTSSTSPHTIAPRHSLAVKLYAIFALFAVLTAAITWLSNYNAHRGAELTHAIETAKRPETRRRRISRRPGTGRCPRKERS